MRILLKNKILLTRSIIAVLVFSLFLFASNYYLGLGQSVNAQTNFCHVLDSTSPIPSPWGAVYDVLSPGKEMLIQATCANNSINFILGSNKPNQYIYFQSYLKIGNQIQPVNLTGQDSGFAHWFRASATAVVPLAPADLLSAVHFYGFICTEITPDVYKCGCTDSTCATFNWQRQEVLYKEIPVPTPTCSPLPPECVGSLTSCKIGPPPGGWCPAPTLTPTPTLTQNPGPTCTPRPACMYAPATCNIAEPVGKWCPIPGQPPMLDLRAEPTSIITGITPGNQSTLIWASGNASNCVKSGGWSGNATLSGKEIVKPTATTTYELTCHNGNLNVKKSVTVTVAACKPRHACFDANPPCLMPMRYDMCPAPGGTPPTISSFTANTATVAQGGQVTFSWSSTNAAKCSLEGTMVPVNGSKALTVSTAPGNPATYVLMCWNGNGAGNLTASKEIKIQVTAAGGTNQPTLTFTANPTSITAGGQSTLTWSSTNATKCTKFDGWTGSATLNGSLVVKPAQTTSYTLDCVNSAGQAVTVVVQVKVSAAKPALSFAAVTPTNINPGEIVTFKWQATNAKTCTKSGAWSGNAVLNGAQQVSPVKNSSYTITCVNGNLSVGKTVTVTIIPGLTLNIIPKPSSIKTGSTTTITWSTTNAASCKKVGPSWNNGAVAVNGSSVERLTTSQSFAIKSFAIKCTAKSGFLPTTIQKSASVYVTP